MPAGCCPAEQASSAAGVAAQEFKGAAPIGQ